MDTNSIKSFAREARIRLREAVEIQLLYWGINAKGEIIEKPLPVSGGYAYREKVYNDSTVLGKWDRLVDKIKASKEGVNDVKEEAAYTWFNRLMAIKILEENNFIEPVLRFEEGSNMPIILQNAKAGVHQVTHSIAKANLQQALLNNADEVALGILIVEYCRKQPLLKNVFGHLNDYTELLLPKDLLAPNGLLQLLNNSDLISEESYKEVELIGWLYQFYISDKKDEVFKGFKAKKKARAQDIPAATQIFTPKWIVRYMVENTVGKTYLSYEEDTALKAEMKYLVESESNQSEGLIEDITALTLFDPACGSGHILVTGFELLYKMYREQGYNAKSAVEHILKYNLYGLDIDERAMQLARFAVLLKAAHQLESASTGQGKVFLNTAVLPIPHIYAFAEDRGFTSEEIGNFTEEKYTGEVYKAIDTLRLGKNIGSALKVELSGEAIEVVQKQYKVWCEKAAEGSLDLLYLHFWEHLQSYVELLLVMTRQYVTVVANPPYMGQKSMNAQLKDYVNKEYPMTKSDLFAVFMEVTLKFTYKNGLMGMINQHSWMFLSSYEIYREYVLQNYCIDNMLHLGPRTFEELSGEVVQSTAFVLKQQKPVKSFGSYYRLVDYKSNNEKEEQFLVGSNFYAKIPQTNFDKIPGSPIAYNLSKELKNYLIDDNNLLGSKFSPKQGLITGDNNLFLRNWTEVSYSKLNEKWYPFNKGGEARRWYGNRSEVVNWEKNGFEIKNFVNEKGKLRSRPQNLKYYFKQGISWSKVSSNEMGVTFRLYDDTFIFSDAGMTLFVDSNIEIYLALLNSKVITHTVKVLNPTINKNIEDINRLPILDIDNDTVKKQSIINTVISKKDWDSRETSWDFKINPLIAQQQVSLRRAFEQWKEKVSQDFLELHANEEELNRIFIDIYGLQEELTPEVALKDVTILQDELKEGALDAIEPAFRQGENITLPMQNDVVISQFISYLIGVVMGRYRLDKEGLHIAHPDPTEEELAVYQVNNAKTPFEMKIDEDAILPLMGDSCAFADDGVKQVKDLVYKLWGDEAVVDNLNFINESLQMDLEKWITEKFWPYHTSSAMYKKKPIYWMFCSNLKAPQKSAFRVLVYMHRMNKYTVTHIIRHYLYPHQTHLEENYNELSLCESELNKDELKKKELLAKQIVEIKEYSEVLKGLADKEITFDLDDGVSVNYAKYEGAVAIIK